MPKFIKIILKVYASVCLLNGINFCLSDPSGKHVNLLLIVVFGWLIWKMWATKRVVTKEEKCEHCQAPKPTKDRYGCYKIEWGR